MKKKLTLPLEKAQSFKVNIPDLFVSMKLINDFWMRSIRFFFGPVCLSALWLPVHSRLMCNRHVFWLK